MPENIHDKFFRDTFSDPALTAEFLRNYLPPELAAALAFDTLEVLKDNFIDDEFKAHLSDLLCRVKLKAAGEIYVYILLEHKSQPAPLVALQLLRYMLKIWERLKLKRGDKLPVIFPLVFYHGARHWRVARSFSALFDQQAFALARGFVPDYEYWLCDISPRSQTPIRGEGSLYAALMTLQHVYDLEEENVAWMAALMEPLLAHHQQDVIIKLLLYLIRAGRVQHAEIKQAIKQVERKHKKKGVLDMNWLDKMIEEGRNEGRNEGLEEGEGIGVFKLLKGQLTQRFGPLNTQLERRLRRLSLAQLQQLGQQLFDLHSHKDLTVWLKQHGA